MSAIDLTTVEIVKSYLGTQSAAALDVQIQLLITSASNYWLWRTGLSSLNSIYNFTETRDGNGNNEMVMWNRPLVTLTSLTVNGQPVAASSGFPSRGYVIKSLGGLACVIAILGVAPPAVYPNLGTPWGGSFQDPDNFLPGFPRGLQNVVAVGTAGYSVTPPDVQDKVTKQVATEVKRRGWLDISNENIANAGTTAYRNWSVSPDILEVINHYKRISSGG